MRAINRNLHREHEHVDTEGTWAISYGDMVTLLLSFFVLYFTVDHKADQAQQLRDSLVASLKSLGNQETKRSSYNLHIGEDAAKNIDRKIVERLGAKIHQVGEKILVEFPGVSFFRIGEINLRDEGNKLLEEFVKIYLPFAGNYTLGIHAFTDTRQVLRSSKKRYRDNLELSALRSVAAMRVLQARGIPLNVMKISGLGELEVNLAQMQAMGIEKSNVDPRDLARKVVLVIEPALSPGSRGS